MARQAHVYRSGGEWYAALWIDGECDSTDSLGIPATASAAEAREEARAQYGEDCSVVRVPDVDADGRER